ncbi:MAG: amidohydrolase family protein [Dehalococcoidia bacterium]|jgi:predicted TIM-barrel fold metal-dependent hydrolase
MIIDSHTHIFSKEVMLDREQYCASDTCFGMLYSSSRARLLCAEELINAMDERCISRSAVLNIGWARHEMCVRTNDYILESVAKYPARLMGFCSIQPNEREKALLEIERCCHAGAKGIGELRPDAQGYDLNDEALMSPLVKYAAKRGMVFLFHASEPVGHIYAGKGAMTPGTVYNFIERHPDLKVILAHFGGGLAFYELMPEVSRVLSNTYYDTAAAPFLYAPKIYNALISIVGSSKILFGSDWPLLDPIRVADHMKSANLDQNDVENIFHANAEKLLGA